MLTNAIVRIIDFCIRHAWSVVLAGVLLAVDVDPISLL